MVKPRKPKETANSLGIRPSPAMRERLKKAAEASGRSINKEAEARLAASFGEVDAGLFAGWPAEDQGRFRTLGEVLALLCARVALTYGYDSDTELHVLGAFELALVELLALLGVEKPNNEHHQFFAMQGRQLLAEIRQATKIKNPTGEKAALAEFARAWGVSVEGAK